MELGGVLTGLREPLMAVLRGGQGTGRLHYSARRIMASSCWPGPAGDAASTSKFFGSRALRHHEIRVSLFAGSGIVGRRPAVVAVSALFPPSRLFGFGHLAPLPS